MKSRKRAALTSIGVIAVASLLLTACGGTSDAPEAAEASISQEVTSEETPTSAELGDSMVDEEETADPQEPQDLGPFLVNTVADPVRYPVQTSSVLSNVQGDIPGEQYTVSWSYNYVPDGDGDVTLARSYEVNPNVNAPESGSDPDVGAWTCLESVDGSSRTCGVMDKGYSMRGNGDYVLYNQKYELGSGDPVKGSRVDLGSFTYTKPAENESLRPALCQLSGGDAVLDESNYVLTINHSGDCSSEDAWLGNVTALIATPDFPAGVTQFANVTEVSHSSSQTVVSVPQEDVERALDWSGEGAEIDGFQVLSGAYEPGYETSTIRIDVN